MAGQFTKGEMCMGGLIMMFMEHASKDGDSEHLSKAEVKEMLEKEFPHFVTGGDSQKMADEIMAGLDANKDGQMDFQEFICLIGSVAIICKMMIQENCKGKC